MKYSTLILTLLMFCITGRSQVASGREDRAYWISILSQVSDPLLNNMSKGELRKNMPVETVSGAANPSNARTTHLEALGRLLVGIAPWLELGPDETSEGQLREKYIQLMLKSIEYGFDPESPDYLNFTVLLPGGVTCSCTSMEQAFSGSPTECFECPAADTKHKTGGK